MDYGKRPYVSPSKNYQEFMAEITDQYVKSIGGVINYGKKRPTEHKNYQAMEYIYNTTKKYLGGAPPTLSDVDWIGMQLINVPAPPALNKRYWVTPPLFSIGDFGDTNNWSLTSGGATGASVPSTGDVAIFDGNSGNFEGSSARFPITVNIGMAVLCGIAIESAAYHKFNFGINENGILSLLSDLNYVNAVYSYGDGILTTNNYNIIINGVFSFLNNSVCTLGTSTITIGTDSDTTTVSCWFGADVTLDADESTIIMHMSGYESTLRNITGSNLGNVELHLYGSSYSFVCDCSFASLSVTGDGYLYCMDSDITVAPNSLTLTGSTPGGLWVYGLTDQSDLTITMASGTVTAKNCTISKCTATGGATFNALTTNGNVDGGDNTGWNFS